MSYVLSASLRLFSLQELQRGKHSAFLVKVPPQPARQVRLLHKRMTPPRSTYNPAGMTQLRRLQFSAGTNLAGGGFSFRSPTGATAHGDLSSAIAIPPPSNFYVSARLKDFGFSKLEGWAVGLGISLHLGSLLVILITDPSLVR